MTRTQRDHNANGKCKACGIQISPPHSAHSPATRNQAIQGFLCYPRGCKIPGPFILAVGWSEENYGFLYFMALVMCSLFPGRAAEKSMPDGSVGDRANGLCCSQSPQDESYAVGVLSIITSSG